MNTRLQEDFDVVDARPAKLPTGEPLIVAVPDSEPGQALKITGLEAVLK